MIQVIGGRIPYVKGDLLVNVANGKGYMGGVIGRIIKLKGVAESIHYADPSIEKMAKNLLKKHKASAGDVFHTVSGTLQYKDGILHAITMDKPGSTSDIDTVRKCLNNILDYCQENQIDSVVIPLLGTGTGRLDKRTVLTLYKEKLEAATTLYKIVI